MIQEHLPKQQQQQQIQQQSEQHSQNFCNSYTVTEIQALSSNNCATIPIALRPNQRILLITTQTEKPTEIEAQQQSIVANTRVISVPFLPRSVPKTHSVKETLPTENDSVKKPNPVTYTHHGTTPLVHTVRTVNTLTGTAYQRQQQPPPQQQQQQINSNSSPHLLQEIVVTQSPHTSPMTLASMAGIQLTDADASLLQGMSGAMPTATVEEINVPVFIDEYLQQTTTTLAGTINNNNINTNGNGNGDQLYIEENGYFDIDMIVGNHMQLEEQQQQQQQQQQQTYQNMTNNINCIDDMFDEHLYFMPELKQEELSQQYRNLPVGDSEAFFSEDTTNFTDTSNIMDLNGFSEEAVDLNNINNDRLLSEVLLNSQNNPWLGFVANESASTSAAHNSQILFANAEPALAKCDELDYKFSTCDSNSNSYGYCGASQNTAVESANVVKAEVAKGKSDCELGLKRSNNNNLSSIPQKRSRLCLNTSFVAAQEKIVELNTPDVVTLVVDWDQNKIPQSFQNEDDIKSYLGIEILTDDTSSLAGGPGDYDEPPCTPQSCSSSRTNNTTYTGDGYSTSPNSPALSTNRKRRGRPSKKHSDRPDPAKLRHLSESERKRLEDRAKNNEASRVSRLKNKQREEEEIEKENELTKENECLRIELEKEMCVERKLKRAVQLFVSQRNPA